MSAVSRVRMHASKKSARALQSGRYRGLYLLSSLWSQPLNLFMVGKGVGPRGSTDSLWILPIESSTFLKVPNSVFTSPSLMLTAFLDKSPHQ